MQCFVFLASYIPIPRLLLGIVQNGELRMKYSYCRASLKTLYSHGEEKHCKGEKILVPRIMYTLCETNFSYPIHCLKISSLFTLEEWSNHLNTAPVWNGKFKYSNLQLLVTINRRVVYRNYLQPVPRIRPYCGTKITFHCTYIVLSWQYRTYINILLFFVITNIKTQSRRLIKSYYFWPLVIKWIMRWCLLRSQNATCRPKRRNQWTVKR
jgi:hypothetical protein